MALIKPTINSGIIFDATNEYDLPFSVPSYSDQVVKNEIKITNQSDNSTVYTNVVSSFQLFSPIPSSSLINGVTYNVQVRTYDVTNNTSDWSDLVSILCLSPAVVTINNISNGLVLSQNFNVTATYSQAENEPILSSKFSLYDSQKNQLDISPEVFGTTLQYEFDGLNNDVNYYVKCDVITQHGLQATSGYIPFLCQYQAPHINNVLLLTNKPDEGAVLASSRIIRVLGHSIGDIKYIDNEWVDITSAGSMVYFDDDNGFTMDSNFTLKIWVKGIQENQIFYTLYGYSGVDVIKLQYYNNRVHAFKFLKDVTFPAHFVSNEITVNSTDTLFIWLKQVNGALDAICEIKN